MRNEKNNIDESARDRETQIATEGKEAKRTYEDHPLASLFPPLARSALAALAEDIRDRGLLDPVWIYEGKILSGRARAKACEIAGIELTTREFKGTRLDAMQLIWSENFHRRHLDSGQLAAVAELYERKCQEYAAEIEKLKDEANQMKKSGKGPHGSGGRGRKKNLREFIPEGFGEERRTATKLAKLAGTNRKYLEACSKLKDPELRDVRDGKLKIVEVIREQNRKRKQEELDSIASRKIREAEGTFDVINIDPPWPMEKILEFSNDSNAVGWPYPVMSLEKIQALKIPAAEDCHVFLWVPAKFVHDAFHLLKGWNLKYTDIFVWKKTTKNGRPAGFQLANHARHNCEFVLHARKGDPKFIDQKNFRSCFDGVLTKHSAKPEEWYELLRRVTAGRRLDMFNRRYIVGFETAGNEAKYRERLTKPIVRERLATPIERERLDVVV